jgi:succinoglycan biosynthesis protein ExoL
MALSSPPRSLANVRRRAKSFCSRRNHACAQDGITLGIYMCAYGDAGPARRMSVVRLDAAASAPTGAPKTGRAIPLKTVYLLPRITEVRCLKRIRRLAREGLQPTTLAFERTGLDIKVDLPHVSLGRLRHGRYWQRPFVFLRVVPRVVPHLREAAVAYCFGLDLLALTWFSRLLGGARTTLVYEVADVLEIQCGTALRSRLIRALERFLLRRAGALVVTSPAYVDGYYCRFRRLPPVFLIENKFGHELEPAAIEAVRATPVCREPDVINIGYFSSIRCMRSIDLLFELAARAGGRIRVYIRGLATDEAIRRRLEAAPPHVVVEGPFNPEADMPAMYRSIDLSWVAYYHAVTNAKMARSNRFYDSCMFGRPMIAQKNSPDGRIVEQKGLGLIIDADDRERAMRAMLALTPAQIAAWRANVLALPRRAFAHEPGDEHADLARFLAAAAPLVAARV